MEKNDREIYKTFICGIVKATAAVRNIENFTKIAYFHFASSTGHTLSQHTASYILSAVIAQKLHACHSMFTCTPLLSLFCATLMGTPKSRLQKNWYQHLLQFHTLSFPISGAGEGGEVRGKQRCPYSLFIMDTTKFCHNRLQNDLINILISNLRKLKDQGRGEFRTQVSQLSAY